MSTAHNLNLTVRIYLENVGSASGKDANNINIAYFQKEILSVTQTSFLYFVIKYIMLSLNAFEARCKLFLKIHFLPHRRHCVFIKKTNCLVLLRKLITACP
jgi:hypothetical protein